MTMITQQEAFWMGSFGTEYATRNAGCSLIDANRALFTEVFRHTGHVDSIIEFGANIGLNLEAIHEIDSTIHLDAVEINVDAACTLANKAICDVHLGSMLRYRPQKTRDLAFTKGVLIHLAPDDLPAAYDVLYRASHQYILMAEYFSEETVEIDYRGNSGKLFKGDFGGQFMARFPDVSLVHKWFVGRDQGIDDLTLWLMEKKA